MGNTGSSSSNRRRRRHGGGSSSEVDHHTTDGHLQQPQPETTYPYIYAAAYTSKYPSPPYFQYQIGSCYPPPPLPAVPLWVPHDEPYYQMARERALEALGDRRYLCTAVIKVPLTYINHQKADTIKYDVNVKKETLKIEADEENPGKFLVSFTFDATVSCSFTLYFFSKEGSEDCNLTTTEEDSLPPFTVSFQEGLAQKFRQKPGTGVHLSSFEEGEVRKGNQTSVYRLVVVAEATPENRDPDSGVSNAQITDAVFKNDKGEFRVTAVKQILWVNGTRYELQEIYGTGNSVDGGDNDGNIDSGKECVICLSEPRDTTALPCRHMCMCNGCAQVLRFQTNQCPICRQPVERLLEIKVNGGVDD